MTAATMREPVDVGPRATIAGGASAAPVRDRLLLAGGPAAVVLALLAEVTAGTTPGTDGRPAELTAFWQQDKLAITAVLFAASALCLGAFAAGLHRVLRDRGDDGPLPVAAVVGGALAAIGLLLWGTLVFTMVDASDKVSGEALQSLNALYEGGWVPIVVGFGLLLLAAGLSARRTRALPAPLTWSAIVLGVCGVLPYAAFATFALGGVWIAVTGALLARGGARRSHERG